jgi:hypothetical protein
VAERNWNDPALIQRGLEELEKVKREVEMTESSGAEAEDKQRAGLRRIVETAARGMRTFARMHGAPPDQEAEQELRKNAEEMTAALDEAWPVVSTQEIAVSARLVVECLAGTPAETQGALTELVKLQIGLGSIAGRVAFAAIAGTIDLDRQQIGQAMRGNAQVIRLARDLMGVLRQEPIDLAAVRVRAKSLHEAAENLARRQPG